MKELLKFILQRIDERIATEKNLFSKVDMMILKAKVSAVEAKDDIKWDDVAWFFVSILFLVIILFESKQIKKPSTWRPF